MAIQQSELILNEDGSIYHLNLKPANIARDIIFVGDQERVDKITKWFDSIEFTTQKREFTNHYWNLQRKKNFCNFNRNWTRQYRHCFE